MKFDSLLSDRKKKIIILFITSFIILGLYFFVHYYQIYSKGYPLSVEATNLIIARNLNFSNIIAVEDKNNVYLSSVLVAEMGEKTNAGNKLTPLFYRYLFNFFGFSVNLPLLICLFLWSLSAVFIFFILFRLFNFSIALIGGIFDILLPYFWITSTTAGFYEVAILFFIIGLFLFLERKKKIYLLLAGIFFALAILARNAFVISVVALIIFDLYQNRSVKRLSLLVLPILVIVGFSFGVDYLNGDNYYLSNSSNSFDYYGHLFPDPYTYHFNRNNYLENMKNQVNGDTAAFLEHYGYKLSFKNKLALYSNSAVYYVKDFFRLSVLGGPLTIFLMIVGFIYLFKINKNLAKMLSFWLLFWYLALIILKTSNADHFVEIRFVIITLSALGLYSILKFIKSNQKKEGWASNVLIWATVMVLFFQFLLTTKFILGREYEGNNIMVKAQPIIKAVNDNKLDKKNDVIAVDIHPSMAGTLNYYTDQNYIYFDPETVKQLIREDKLKDGFGYFGVTAIAGFSDELMKQASDLTGVKVIKTN